MKGKVVFITGASSGIGEYIAYALAKHGVKLVLAARRKDELERVKRNCIGILFSLLHLIRFCQTNKFFIYLPITHILGLISQFITYKNSSIFYL